MIKVKVNTKKLKEFKKNLEKHKNLKDSMITNMKNPRHNSKVYCQSDKRNKHKLQRQIDIHTEYRLFKAFKRQSWTYKTFCVKCHYSEEEITAVKKWKLNI